MERWHTDGEAPWSWMHDHRDVRKLLDGRKDQMAQERRSGVLSGARGRLHDDRAVGRRRAFHDGAHLLEVVDVEGGNAVVVLRRVIE